MSMVILRAASHEGMMRVTSETKAATRHQILLAAEKLFREKGFDDATTRDIARAAGVASGTLFNYFATKEAVLAVLAADAVGEACEEVGRPGGAQTLEEALFALVASTLRKLKPLRRHLPALLETALSPIAAGGDDAAGQLRTAHLEAVGALGAKYGYAELPPTALQLYWTLFTGVLAFWARDASPKQEATLALIDDSLEMYVSWLGASGANGDAG
jgi:AcrR family transcriptional regulator